MATVVPRKPDLRILEGTQQAFSLGVSRYYKGAAHDDEIDALSSAIETLGTSDIVAQYVKMLEVMKR